MSFGITNPSAQQLRGAKAAVARIQNLQQQFKQLDDVSVSAEIAPGMTVDNVLIDQEPGEGYVYIENPVKIGDKLCKGGLEFDADEMISSNMEFTQDGLRHEYSFDSGRNTISYHERVYREGDKSGYHGEPKALVFRNIHIDPSTGNIVELALGGSELKDQ